MKSLRFYVFGSSLVSAYWNGAATYYRGLYKHLHALGHAITFAEPDIYGRQQHRDAEDVSAYAEARIYRTRAELDAELRAAGDADVVVLHSGIGADDDYLAQAVVALGGAAPPGRRPQAIYWDVDAPATLAEIEARQDHYLRALLPRFAHVFTYGGGQPVVRRFLALGARNCLTICNAFDPRTHFRVAPDPAWESDLAFVGHRLPDRETRVEEYFMAAARLAPARRFLLAGAGWEGRALPPNVRYAGHAPSHLHNVVNSSARLVLNLNRESMARCGFSPPTRIFEAAGAAAAVITDAWPGIDEFFAPGREILLAQGPAEIVAALERPDAELRHIGERMRAHARLVHTYAQRARLVHDVLMARPARDHEASDHAASVERAAAREIP